MRTPTRAVLVSTLALSLLARSAISIAAPGALDPSFGSGGIAVGPVGYFTDAGLQSDGAIVAVGSDPRIQLFTVFRIVLRPDGGLDTTFGEGGAADSGCGSCLGSWSRVTIQPDDKIVILGVVQSISTLEQGLALPRIARYLPDGTIDRSFRDSDPFNDFGYPTGLVSSPRGDILVAAARAADDRLLLARLDRDGALDPSFGNGGIADLGFDRALSTGLTLQADGKVLALADRAGSNPADAVLIRLLRNGQLDPRFGVGGVVGIDLGPHTSPSAIALQSGGSILVGGTDDASGIFLARYDRSGRLDQSFGTSDVVRSRVANGLADLRVESDGGIVVLGEQAVAVGSRWVVARFDRNGSPDASFGRQGSVVTKVSTSEFGTPLRLLPSPQGKLLAVGSLMQSGLAAVRYLDTESACRQLLFGWSRGASTSGGSGASCGSGVVPLTHFRRVPGARAH